MTAKLVKLHCQLRKEEIICPELSFRLFDICVFNGVLMCRSTSCDSRGLTDGKRDKSIAYTLPALNQPAKSVSSKASPLFSGEPMGYVGGACMVVM